MYCKNCGKQLETNAKFCDGCGTPTGKGEQVSQPAKQQTSNAAPRQFGYNDNLEDKRNVQYQKTAFKGKQWNAGSSGKVEFGNGRRKGGFIGKIIKFAVVVTVVIVAAVLIFGGGCDDVCSVETSTSVNNETYKPVDKTTEFSPSDSSIFLTFEIDGYDSGSKVDVTWIYLETDFVIANDTAYSSQEGLNNVLFELLAPTDGWPVGDYEVEIYVNGDYITSAEFSVVN